MPPARAPEGSARRRPAEEERRREGRHRSAERLHARKRAATREERRQAEAREAGRGKGEGSETQLNRENLDVSEGGRDRASPGESPRRSRAPPPMRIDPRAPSSSCAYLSLECARLRRCPRSVVGRRPAGRRLVRSLRARRVHRATDRTDKSGVATSYTLLNHAIRKHQRHSTRLASSSIARYRLHTSCTRCSGITRIICTRELDPRLPDAIRWRGVLLRVARLYI
jgi:hypothetical protein